MIDRVTQHFYILRTMFGKERLLFTVFLGIFFSCNPPVQSEKEIDPITDVTFSYLQDDGDIFLSAKLKDPFNGIDLYSVQLFWYATNGLDYESPDSIYLNDAGEHGDILKGDDVYSRKLSIENLTNPLVYNDTGTVYLQVEAMYVDSAVFFVADSFSLGNIKPKFVWIDAPDTLVLPDPGLAKLITIRSKVKDSNGMDDIQWVGFTSRHVEPDTMLSGGNYLFLYDDGDVENHGDVAAGDSIYSLIISFPYNAKTGEIEWRFRVQDWSNEYRDTTHTVLVMK